MHGSNSTFTWRLGEGSDWIEGARKLPSPNYDQRPGSAAISLIIVHGISMPPGCFGGDGIDRLFTNSLDTSPGTGLEDLAGLKVSSHLMINREGELTQYVPLTKRAWHAGVSCFAGQHDCNDFSIGIELEGCDHVPYSEEQYHALAAVIILCRNQWQDIDRSRVVAHSAVAPGRKTDPGPAFSWPRLHRLLAGREGK